MYTREHNYFYTGRGCFITNENYYTVRLLYTERRVQQPVVREEVLHLLNACSKILKFLNPKILLAFCAVTNKYCYHKYNYFVSKTLLFKLSILC